MTRKKQTTGKRTYRVFADHTTLMFQEIEATDPRAALALAQEQSDDWRFCSDFDDRDNFVVSNEVWDVETEESFLVGDQTPCKTCGSEIVPTVNDTQFRDGDCGGCEYARYRDFPKIVKKVRTIRGLTESLDYKDGDVLRRLSEQERALDEIRGIAYAIVNRPHGA